MTRKPDHSNARKSTIVLPGLVVGVVLGTLLQVPVAGLIVGGLVILFLLAVWYDFAVIESPSKYNDFIIVEEISREERDAGNRGTIIGNGKLPGKHDERQSTNNEPF